MGERLRVLAWPADANRTGNPYNARLADGLRRLGVVVDEFSPARVLRGRYDVWHAHWPDGALGQGGAVRAAAGAGATLALAAIARMRGTRIVWTVHNLRAHRRIASWVENPFWRGWSKSVDVSIHLSESARRAAFDAFPSLTSRPSFVIPHPHYRADYPPPPPKGEARSALGLPHDASAIGFVGHIRAYKGVPQLIRAFTHLPDPLARLLVAGRPESEELGAELREAAAGDMRVLLRLDEMPAERLPVVVAATDLVVLPYDELLNSGAALLALSFGRPVLVPDRGAMADLRTMVGTDWVKLYHGSIDTGALAQTLAGLAANPPGPPVPLDAFDPGLVAQATLDAYREVTAGHERAR